MKKILLATAILSSSLLAQSTVSFKDGLKVHYNDGESEIIIKREKPQECKSIKFGVKNILGGSYASGEINPKCKKTYVTYFGSISPMIFTKGVDTYGELEVLDFIKKAQDNENMLVVDSRTENWYLHFTIPSAVNAPYTFLKQSQYPEEYGEVLDTFGVKTVNGKYDFSEAKELLLFCNAVWCSQSIIAMTELIRIGYPKEKLKWYRAGIQGWTSLGLQTIVPE